MPKQIVETYSKEVREYLEGRGIDQKTALKEKVYEFSMAGRPIMGFPFYINLTLVNVKYFDVRWQLGQDSPKWWQMKKDLGTKSIFLGMQSLSFDVEEKKEVIICEGEWDWLTWKQAGYKNVVSVPMGAPNPDAMNFY
jgi:twinkle protein